MRGKNEYFYDFYKKGLTKKCKLAIMYINRTPRTEVLLSWQSMWPMGGRFYA
jgi:hypothetical protein